MLQFPGGHSNLTYLVQADGRELVLRRPPVGNTVKGAHDVEREARILERLHPVYAKAPRVVVRCEDAAVLGAPFFMMERVPGLVVRRQAPPGVDVRVLTELVVDGLVELHALDVARAGLLDLGKPEGFVERQVRGWSERYLAAQTDVIADMDDVGSWLLAHLPVSLPPTMVHNDWKLDNLVLSEDHREIRGVLDWEMATVGDPLTDLGTTLAYWAEADDPPALRAIAFGPTDAPSALTRRDVVVRYAERSGRDVSQMDFYHRLALFKTAVIAQQIYARYAKGLTRDERFAGLIHAVRALAAQAAGGRVA